MRSFIRTRPLCEWDDFDARAAFARSRLTEGGGAPLPPFLLLAEPGLSPGEQRASSEDWMRERLATAEALRASLAFRFPPREADRKKIKLGYLSNDFQDHATALLLVESLEARDAARFELHAYSYGRDDGKEMRARLRRRFRSLQRHRSALRRGGGASHSWRRHRHIDRSERLHAGNADIDPRFAARAHPG